MTGLLILLAAALAGIACYNLSCACVDVPTAQTSRMMMRARKQTGTSNEKLFDVYLTKIAGKLAPLLRLDPIKRGRLALTLSIAGIPLTPECYTMKAFLTAFATGLLGIPLFMAMPLMGLLVMGLAVTLWFSTYYKAFDLVKKRRKLIEAELPRFAASIQQGLATDRDVLKLLATPPWRTCARATTRAPCSASRTGWAAPCSRTSCAAWWGPCAGTTSRYTSGCWCSTCARSSRAT